MYNFIIKATKFYINLKSQSYSKMDDHDLYDMEDIVQVTTAKLNRYFSQTNCNTGLKFDSSKTHSLGQLVHLSNSSGQTIFLLSVKKMELIDIFMQLIGASCPQLKLCTILVDNIIDVQRVQKHWIN
jgi:hypothetical protein